MALVHQQPEPSSQPGDAPRTGVNMNMSDVFISYARADREKAAQLAQVLEQAGRSVWWDNDIPAGKKWADVIEGALTHARCVVVLWSSASVSSHWVNTEAREGLGRGILIPVLLEEVAIPLEFRAIQSLRLLSWPDHSSSEELHKLITSVALTLGTPLAPRPVPPPVVAPRKWMLAEAVALSSRYFTEFLQLVSGPKTFLGSQLAERERVFSSAALFVLGSYIVGFLLTLPLPAKHQFVTFVSELAYVLFKIVLFGFAVYLSWRLVGAKAPLRDFLSIHFYTAGVLHLLEKCAFLTVWGLLRVLSDSAWFAQVQDVMFCKAEFGSYMQLLKANLGVVQIAAMAYMLWVVIAIAWIIVFWGAYRQLNSLSRTRSLLAGLLFVPLGAAALAITIIVANALLSPQC